MVSICPALNSAGFCGGYLPLHRLRLSTGSAPVLLILPRETSLEQHPLPDAG
jgi:hypothetical protein